MNLIYVTHENEAAARKIVEHLLSHKLIACANLIPITSIYPWKGNVEETAEVVTILKTRDALWEEVRSEIENIHPYEVPCILRIPVEANTAYEEWVEKETEDASRQI